MKFKNKIEMCRHDEKVTLGLILDTKEGFQLSEDCVQLDGSICSLDIKKCKIVTYVKEVRND